MKKTYNIPTNFDVKRVILKTLPTECVITMNGETIVDSKDEKYGKFNFDTEAMSFLITFSTEQVFETFLYDLVTESFTDLLQVNNEIIITLK